MTILIFLVATLCAAVLLLSVLAWVMLRQIGVLYERIAPFGALVDSAGPAIGEPSAAFLLPSLNGGQVTLGAPQARAQLLFFLSPSCPVCKQLLPVLAGVSADERDWLDIVLASDGDAVRHRAFIARHGLGAFPYVLAPELGMSFRVQRLPFAVLVDRHGVVRAKGLVNTREQLESLFHAQESGVPSIQQHGASRGAE